MNPIIKIIDLSKNYKIGKTTIRALEGINFEVQKGEFIVVFGPSGSGKTTLLSLIAGLEKPTSGQVIVGDHNIFSLNERDLARYRRREIGMVFQQFNLISEISARDNVAIPLILSGVSRREAHKRADYLLSLVEIKEFAHHRPFELSGGQQQRIAIARALSTNPEILFVDEPTGSLDVETGREIISLLQTINKKWGRTIILVTHNPEFLSLARRVIFLEDGKINQIAENSQTKDLSFDQPVKFYKPSRNGNIRFWELFRLSRIHFFSKKIRTFLTTLGVVLGVGAIVTLVSLGIGLQRITASQLASLDSLVTIDVSLSKNSIKKLNDQAAAELAKIDHVSLVSPTVSLPAKVTLNNSISQAIVTGVKPEAISFESASPAIGRSYTKNEGIVVSTALAKAFDADNPEKLIGKEIILNLVVLSETTQDPASLKGIELKDKIVGVCDDELVSSVYLSLERLVDLTGVSSYGAIKVKAADRRFVESIRNALDQNGYSTSSVVDLINRVDKVFYVVEIILGIIGGVALIVALIGIVNIMTISLLERTHEVGVLKAVGATNKDIRRMFEYEVILFGLFGSILGVFSSWSFGQAVNGILAVLMRANQIQGNSLTLFVTPPEFMIEVVLLTILISLLAGIYPARRAGKLSPTEALRSE